MPRRATGPSYQDAPDWETELGGLDIMGLLEIAFPASSRVTSTDHDIVQESLGLD